MPSGLIGGLELWEEADTQGGRGAQRGKEGREAEGDLIQQA